MSAWSGWVGDILSAGGWPDTADNRQFLTDWALYEPSGCAFNPLLASRGETGSTACKRLSSTRTAQNYTSKAQGTRATVAQIDSGNFDNLKAALASGTPFDSQHSNGVALDLQKWGADAWSQNIGAISGADLGAGGGGGGGPGKKPHAMGAWSRWMHALAHQLPADIRQINRDTARLNRIARHR